MDMLESLAVISNSLTHLVLTSLLVFYHMRSKYNVGNWKGTIPTELGLLENLEALHLESTSISGTIPSELAKASKLFDMRLALTELTGSMPAELDCTCNWVTLSADCAVAQGRGIQAKVECSCCTECHADY